MNELVKPKLHVLNLKLLNIHMCVQLHHVKKVLPLVYLENIPGCPNYLAGLMNMGGKSIPTIDLALRLGLQRKSEYTLDMPILLCSDGDNLAGIIVDQVIELSVVDETALQMNDEFNKPDSPFIATIVKDVEQSLLLNMSQILNISLTWDKSQSSVEDYLNNMTKRTS